MQVLIATPTAGHVVPTVYAHSLVAATRAIHALEGTYQHLIFNGADVVLARNYMAHELLKDPYLTHMLFLDSDILVDEHVLRRLLKAGQPIVGAIYPERTMDWTAYRGMLKAGIDEQSAQAAALNFNARPIDGGYAVSKGWCKVGGIGAGCLLIKREVFAALIRNGAAKPVRSRKLATHLDGVTVQDGRLHDFFGHVPADDGDYLSEDYSFCHRAISAGFEIWGLADTAVSHVGRFEYSARFLDHLEQTATRQDVL